MKKTPMRACSVVLASLVAALLLAPCAQAGGRKRVQRRVPAAAAAARSSALIQAGLEHLERQEFSMAIAQFTKACRAHSDSSSHFLLGYAYYQRGFSSGDTDNADKQDALEAISAYSTAIALDPGLTQIRQPYKLYHSLALSYEALGNFHRAAEAYKQALAAAPHNPMLPLYAARLRYRMSDSEKSVANLSLSLQRAKAAGQLETVLKVVQTDPKFSMMLASQTHLDVLRHYDPSAEAPAAEAPAMATSVAMAQIAPTSDPYGMRDSVNGTSAADPRGAALRQQDNDVLDALASANDQFNFRRYRQAIAGYNQALDLNQRSGVLNPTQAALVLERIGTSYNKLGQSAEAIRALRQCVQTTPMAAGAHYQLALAYSLSGRFRDSLHALNETLRAAPSTGELKRYMLLAKTDSELEPVRDLPAFKSSLDEHRQRALGR